MVTEWLSCTLAEACSSIDYGLTASAADHKRGPKFLRITDIVAGHIDWNSVPHVEADGATFAKYRLQDGDIVLARTGASTGASAYVKNPPPTVFASYLVRLQTKPNFDSRFLSYYLRSDAFWDFIRAVLGDKSAQPNASASTMTKAPLQAPRNKDEQRAIAHVLGTLDDKIELNHRMNETLEAITRAIFKSWFVDFDPVRAKASGEPPESICRRLGFTPELLALFPDRFVDSELGEIPEGWEVKPLDEIADYLNGLALQKFPPESESEWLPVIKIAQLKSGSTVGADRASHVLNPSYVVADGDVLFSWSGSLEVDVWCGGRGALNQHLFKVTSSSYPKWFFFHWARQHLPHFRTIAAGKAVTMGHIQRKHLTEALCAVPRAPLLNRADGVIATMLQYQIENRRQSRTLAATRDALLPELLSGELRVPLEGLA